MKKTLAALLTILATSSPALASEYECLGTNRSSGEKIRIVKEVLQNKIQLQADRGLGRFETTAEYEIENEFQSATELRAEAVDMAITTGISGSLHLRAGFTRVIREGKRNMFEGTLNVIQTTMTVAPTLGKIYNVSCLVNVFDGVAF